MVLEAPRTTEADIPQGTKPQGLPLVTSSSKAPPPEDSTATENNATRRGQSAQRMRHVKYSNHSDVVVFSALFLERRRESRQTRAECPSSEQAWPYTDLSLLCPSQEPHKGPLTCSHSTRTGKGLITLLLKAMHGVLLACPFAPPSVPLSYPAKAPKDTTCLFLARDP